MAAVRLLSGPAENEDDFHTRASLRALVLRLRDLSHVVMGALNEDDEPVKNLQAILSGEASHA
jgi:hypothetical protein